LRNKEYHQNGLLVSGFLGGLAFTALVLVLQASKSFSVPNTLLGIGGESYFEILTASLACISFLSIVASFAMLHVASYIESENSPIALFGEICFVATLMGFAYVLPLLLLPFTTLGSIVVLSLDMILLITFFVLRRLPRIARRRRRKFEAAHRENENKTVETQTENFME